MLVSLIGVSFFASTCIINGQESTDKITLNNKTKIIDSIDNTLDRRDVNVSGIYYPRGDYSNYRVLHITR